MVSGVDPSGNTHPHRLRPLHHCSACCSDELDEWEHRLARRRSSTMECSRKWRIPINRLAPHDPYLWPYIIHSLVSRPTASLFSFPLTSPPSKLCYIHNGRRIQVSLSSFPFSFPAPLLCLLTICLGPSHAQASQTHAEISPFPKALSHQTAG